MRDTLIAAIVMAAISSLAFIAYKHPKGYARMFWPIWFVTFGCWACWMVYQIAYTVGFSDAALGYLRLNREVHLKEPTHDDVSLWAWMLPSVFMLYLVFLYFLPRILDLPVDDRKEDDPKDKVSEKGSDNDA